MVFWQEAPCPAPPHRKSKLHHTKPVRSGGSLGIIAAAARQYRLPLRLSVGRGPVRAQVARDCAGHFRRYVVSFKIKLLQYQMILCFRILYFNH